MNKTIELQVSESFVKSWLETMGDLSSIQRYLLDDLRMGLELNQKNLPKDATMSCSVYERPSWENGFIGRVGKTITQKELDEELSR